MAELIHELREPISVVVTSLTLPKGVTAVKRGGSCLAWWVTEHTCLWMVALQETGEVVWVPMKELRLAPSWSSERRYVKEAG